MPTALDAYWSTYNYTCSPTSSFLSSWQYIVYPLHYSNVFFIPLAILAGYCVLYKTPKPMQPMKWVYFNLHFWISFQSVYVSLLLTPVLWLPSISGSFLGLLTWMGVFDVYQGYFGSASLMMSMAATICLFENRHQQIQNNRLRTSRTWLRFSMLGFNYLYALIFPIPLYLILPDQTQAKLSFLKNVPCPHEDFFTLPMFFFASDPEYQKYLAIALFLGLTLTIAQLLFYAITCLYYLVFNASSTTSKVTHDRQKRFFFGVLFQVFAPYSFISPSMIYTSWSMLNGYYNQIYNNLVILMLNFYGTAATSFLLLCHSPYREFVKQLLKKLGNLLLPMKRSSVQSKRGSGANRDSVVFTNV